MSRARFGMSIDYVTGATPKATTVICSDAAATIPADIVNFDGSAISGSVVSLVPRYAPLAFRGPDGVGTLYCVPTTASTVYPLTATLNTPSSVSPFFNVKDYGAKGNGSTDDTAAFKAALVAGAGGTVYVPGGIYMINADKANGFSVVMDRPYTHLLLEPSANLKAITNALTRYGVVTVIAADCTITGGTITGDLDTHTGTTGEWGFCIDVWEAAHRLKVTGTKVTKAWGDGICIADRPGIGAARPADISLEGVIADDNRRQGLSIISALRPQVIGGSYINTGVTKVTPPGAGIALEPNPSPSEQNITDAQVSDVICSGNAGRGLYLHAQGQELTAAISNVRATNNLTDGFASDSSSNVSFTGCQATGNTGDGYSLAASSTRPGILVSCTATLNTRFGFGVSASDMILSACHAQHNAASGFYLDVAGSRNTLSGCTTKGNCTTSTTLTRDIEVFASYSTLVGIVYDAGQNATKPTHGINIRSGAVLCAVVGCIPRGAYSVQPYFGQTDTIITSTP